MKAYVQYIKEIKSLGLSSRLLKNTRHNNNIILTVCSATSNFNKHALNVLVIILKMSMQVQLVNSTFTNNFFMLVNMVNYYNLYKYIYTNLRSFLFYDTSSVVAT